MQNSPERAKIVNAIIGLSKNLGSTTVADGIEDVDALRRMIDEGCDFGQGVLFGRAVSASETKELIERSSRRGERLGARASR
jgi:EAL domain-containing protein (putative c-di-GMP-specific phosphodiesterase class I)